VPKSRKRNKKPSSGGGAGGGMMALRGGFKNFMGAGRGKGKPPTLTSRILDTALWVAVIGLVVVLFYNRFSQ
jgi:hypothetical protein